MDMLDCIVHFILLFYAWPIFCQKLCTKRTPSGGLVFRINETGSNVSLDKINGAEDPGGGIVLDMSNNVGDKKLGSSSDLDLRLVDNPGDYFRLNPTNKQLILQKPLDRDGQVDVKVFVNDLNDNRPKFVNTPYIANVYSFAQVGSIIFDGIKAVDEDSEENAFIKYRILRNLGTPKNASLYFGLIDNRLVLTKPLDFMHYKVVLEARDSPKNRKERQVATASVSVNVVGRSPSFVHPLCSRLYGGACSNVEYTITIRAETMPGIQPLSVSPNSIEAFDLDRSHYPIRYSFVNGTPSNYDSYFFIDAQSGAVSQLRPVPNQLTRQFNITVMATISGEVALPSFAFLRIDVENSYVNSYPPILKASSFQGFIEENSEMGATVRTSETANSPLLQILVTDADLKPGMPPATYQYILTGIGASVFAVNQGGYVYLNTPNLDADPPNPLSYQLTIQAREVGTNPIRSSDLLTLTINVLDINDNAPSFGSQSLEAVALADIGQQNIIELRARDTDRGVFGEISYRIVSVSNHGEPFFRYNYDTGYIVAIAPLHDKEQYQILLEAKDGGGRSTQAVVLVDVEKNDDFLSPNAINENSVNSFAGFPYAASDATEFNVSVSELAPVNSVVLSLKNSMPAAFGYAIVRGNEDRRFRIDPNSGTLMTVLPLDRELREKYRILVQTIGYDRNITAIVNIDVLDENDNTPRILNNQPIVFQVQEGRGNEIIGKIQAVDSDSRENGRITFSLIPLSQKFTIDHSDGTLRTTLPLKYTDAPSYNLTVIAKDNGTIPNESNVRVMVLVLPPLVQQPYFRINFYNITVPENGSPREILKVEATQPDLNGAQVTYELRQGDPSLFAVDGLTGAIRSLASLDAESKRFHTLIVGTRQNTQQYSNGSATTVIVNVEDVNDWTPLFRPFSYTATITDIVAPGTPITQVTAEDNDLDPPNNIIRYQITGFGEAREYFKIDPISGLIIVSANLQHAPKPDLILLVEAKDNGSPSLSSTATVAVTVRSSLPSGDPMFVPVTDNAIQPISNSKPSGPIKFSVKSFSASVSEAATPPYFVQILPVDNKPNNRQSVQCNIVSGNFAGAFSMSVNIEGNCELRTETVLDREKINLYILNISVSTYDQRAGMSYFDFAEVMVFIIDVNDNAPQFQYENDYLGYRMYFGALDINAREFSRILTVKATDADAGNNSQIVYSLVGDSPDAKYFQISPEGELKNVKVFSTIVDKATMFFQFRVEAKDAPSQSLAQTSTADVTVNAITNINRFVMVLEGILPDQTLKYIPIIKKSLQNKTGSCRILGYESVTESSSLAAQEKPGTEIVWYAIDPTTGLICRRNQFGALFEEDTIRRVRGELDVYFKMQTIRESSPVVYSSSASIFSYDKWQAAEIALIVLACVIAVGAIIGILAMCYFWTRYKASRRAIVPIDKMQLYAALPKYNALLLPPSEKEYEIQTLQMALPEEQDNGKIAEADFSIEEGIYSIQPAGRLDPFLHHSHNRQPPPHVYIPPPDYPLSNSNNNSHVNLAVHQRHRLYHDDEL